MPTTPSLPTLQQSPMPHLLRALFLSLLLLSPLRADDAFRAEIQATFDSISKAVLAADQKAYLAHIDSSHPHFYAEHIHWSDELARFTPAAFSLAIGDGPATFTSTSAEFPLVMSWRFDNGPADNWGTNPAGRTVTFPTVRFIKKDNRWLYAGEKWNEVVSPDGSFTVRFLPGSEKTVEDVLKAYPIAKAHVDAEFQRPVTKPQTLVLYQSMDHLKATVYLNMPDTVLGGWSEADESIKFMHTYTRGVSSWTAAYAHEYAHVATWELGPGSRAMPWWVQEGVAELCALMFKPGYADRLSTLMRRRAAAGTLADWSEISDYLHTKPNLKSLAYTQGDSMMQFITARFEREGRNRWLQFMAAGKPLEDATREAFNLGFAELDALWRKHIAPDDPKTAAAVRPAIEQLLSDMSAAVLKADQSAYLAFVSKADAVFAKEQENWAKDLGIKAPEAFTLELGEELTIDDSGAAVAELTTRWRMPGGRDREVSFPARFVKTREGAWLYAGEQWLVHKGEGSLVMYEEESLRPVAETVASLLPEIRAHVDEGFGHLGKEAITGAVQQVKLYTSMKHLQHSIYLSYTDGLGGWNEPGESIKILTNPGARQGMLRVLLGHEYGHVATFVLGPKASDMPWWILEGVAELSAAKYARNWTRVDRMVKAWAKTEKLIPWDKLADFRGEAANHQLNVYNQGHHMVAFIATAFSRPKLTEWIAAQANGAPLDRATRDVLGLSFDELDTKWRESLVEAPAEKPAE